MKKAIVFSKRTKDFSQNTEKTEKYKKTYCFERYTNTDRRTDREEKRET